MSGRVPQQQQLVTLPPAQSPQAVATSNYPTTNTSLRTRPQSTQMQVRLSVAITNTLAY